MVVAVPSASDWVNGGTEVEQSHDLHRVGSGIGLGTSPSVGDVEFTSSTTGRYRIQAERNASSTFGRQSLDLLRTPNVRLRTERAESEAQSSDPDKGMHAVIQAKILASFLWKDVIPVIFSAAALVWAAVRLHIL